MARLAMAEKQRDEWRVKLEELEQLDMQRAGALQKAQTRIAELEKAFAQAKKEEGWARGAVTSARNEAQGYATAVAEATRALEAVEKRMDATREENVVLTKINRLLSRRLAQALLGAHLDEVPK